MAMPKSGSPLKMAMGDSSYTNGTSDSAANHSTKSHSPSKDRKHSSEHRHRSGDSKHRHSHSSSRHHGNRHSSSSSSSHRHRDEKKREHGSSSSSSSAAKKPRCDDGASSPVKTATGNGDANASVNNHVMSLEGHRSPGTPPHVKSEPMLILTPVKYVSPVKVAMSASEELSPAKRVSPMKICSPLKTSPVKSEPMKSEPMDSDDDVPLTNRSIALSTPPSAVKRHVDSDDDVPLSSRAEKSPVKKRKTDDDDEFKPDVKKKMKTERKEKKKESRREAKKEARKDHHKKGDAKKAGAKDVAKGSKAKTKKEKEAEEEKAKWRWWEEDRKDDGTKWRFLEHKGPVFAPPYERVPSSVQFYYEGAPMVLTEATEEVATFYARMLDHDYTTRDLFNRNFFKDWRKVMTLTEKAKITDLKKCGFKEMHAHFLQVSEDRKNRTKDEKLVIKHTNEQLVVDFGFCVIDHHTEKIGNFRIEPPSLFRGRGDHPKQGMLKKRVQPESVIINCSADAQVPPPPAGHKWKEVRHDNEVTWLACWTENVQNSTKYVMLNAGSRLKGEKDWQKYETARKLHKHVDRIRAQYRQDWKSKEMRIRQRAVAMYFIDKLALRAGNEKDEEQADTVGCCSLRVEHLKLHEKMDGDECVVEFDFLGKDSIRYYNKVTVEKRVFKNLVLFTDNKQGSDDIFDRLNTAILNKHLQSLMDDLTAKVFRTYNASITLQQQLELLTVDDDPLPAKMLSYNRANRSVAVLCNHQRAVPKNFSKQMDNLQTKIDAKKMLIKDTKKDVKAAKSDVKNMKTDRARTMYDKKKKTVERLQDQLTKLEVQATDKDENKEIALGTSKLNYLDPRISVSWCKKFDVPLEKIYNKTQRDKFAWAVDMADEDFSF